MNNMRNNSSHQGVALIEAMVALAIVAIALTALLHSLNISSNSHQHLRNKTLARWLAANQLNQAYIQHRYFNVQPLRLSGSVDMWQQRWHWRLQKNASGLPGLQRWSLGVNLLEQNGNQQASPQAQTLFNLERLVLQ